jgi:adenosine kinase
LTFKEKGNLICYPSGKQRCLTLGRDAKMLEKYGLKPNDAILAEEKHMGLYEDLIQNHDAKLIAGGAAQNTARGAQYILPADSVVYIGCVGNDKYGETLKKTCAEAGLRVEYRHDEEQPTGRCGVIITGHDRSMCTDLAAANCYKVDHLKSEPIWKLVEQAKVYFVGGYHLTVCVDAIMALAEEAAAKNKVYFQVLVWKEIIAKQDTTDLHVLALCAIHSSILQGTT